MRTRLDGRDLGGAHDDVDTGRHGEDVDVARAIGGVAAGERLAVAGQDQAAVRVVAAVSYGVYQSLSAVVDARKGYMPFLPQKDEQSSPQLGSVQLPREVEPLPKHSPLSRQNASGPQQGECSPDVLHGVSLGA
nr:hypothetical protein CFP56_04232 [Quercus suber]